ncbi:hypothetical protein MLD38_034199 [Melastoma candidum]|uniref:Uncharacterized protein n=1 Tax=Melastoma candidum TaxID=119954 RepID=A0ACB9MBT6_9MYRT|nr:hypothetical protein MLD38_034199 [Melastoma candidum]
MPSLSQQRPKKRSMSRSNSGGFFACFRPMVPERDDHLVRSRSSPIRPGRIDRGAVTAYVGFHDGKEAAVLPGIPPFPRRRKGEVDDPPRKEGTRKKFVRATKAILFEMSLVKKVEKKRKSKKTTEEPNVDLFKRAERILRLMSHGSGSARKSKPWEDSTRSNNEVSVSPHSSASASSRSLTRLNQLSSTCGSRSNTRDVGTAKLLSSSISSEPKKTSTQDRPQSAPARAYSSLADAPMCLILLTLVVLIFWGKLCAIVLTSTCMVVSFPASASHRSSSDEADDSLDSVEYKKRIIMEGLLQRQRSGGPQPPRFRPS